jgi:predicted acylesterase/phospholipase RssA
MAGTPHSALVLQGGGALGAYELGAARAFYEDPNFAPDVIAGVSIGAITAALLARPGRGRKPLEALEAFWREVTVPGTFLPPPLRPYASFLGNRKFYVPRLDFLVWPTWTYFYETAPLRETLAKLVDVDALADPKAVPKLLVSATDVEKGEIVYFRSDGKEGPLTLDHIMASGSLPPPFPQTEIKNKTDNKKRAYWDGGLSDNTPLGAVLDELDKLKGAADGERTVYVVNLFPKEAPVPQNMIEIMARMKNLQFVNKTEQDVKLMCRFNQVAALMEALEGLGEGNPLKDHDAFKQLQAQGYKRVPRIVSITTTEAMHQFDDADFSPEAIKKRADEGYAQTKRALQNPIDPCADV